MDQCSSESNSINSKFNALELHELVRTILSANKIFQNGSNLKILRATISFIKQTQ